MEFAVIFNNDNWFFKFEVWAKGTAVHNDSMGQPLGKQSFVQKIGIYRRETNARLYIQRQAELREFIGVVA